VVIFLQAEAQEREGRRFTPTRTIGSTREIPFRGFVGGKTETSSFGFAKLRSPKPRQGGKFRSGGQYLDTCRSPSISFRGFMRREGLVDFRPKVPKSKRCDKVADEFGISTLSGVEGIPRRHRLRSEIAKCSR
jgi:hypothetical protein